MLTTPHVDGAISLLTGAPCRSGMWRSRGRSPAESEQKYTVVPTVQRLPSAGRPCVCSQSPDGLRVTGLHRTCAGLCARDSDRIVDSLPVQGTIYPSNIVHRLRRTFSVTRCCSQRPCDVCFHSFPELSGPRAVILFGSDSAALRRRESWIEYRNTKHVEKKNTAPSSTRDQD